MSKPVLAFLQARTSSSRLPGKVLLPLGNKPMILFQLERIATSKFLDGVVLLTSTDPSDDYLASLVEEAGFDVFRGDLNDVLERFKSCSAYFQPSTVVRLTGDCPLVDPLLIDEIIQEFSQGEYDYLGNSIDDIALSVPDGCDIEVFRASLLSQASSSASLKSEREHVTPWFKTSQAGLNWKHYVHKTKFPYFRITVDYVEDLYVVQTLVREVSRYDPTLKLSSLVKYLQDNPQLSNFNCNYIRNDGYTKSLKSDVAHNLSSGQQLWAKAKSLIPGGNMLLSKRPEMFLPSLWPTYYQSAQGCSITDLDGRQLIDLSLMGVGTNILGYAQSEVDRDVLNNAALGNMCSLNCPEEVHLAEKLVAMHSWADMVRFARTGGEANAIAIRIARAATGKDCVAVCGYHGWHDWYLASNLPSGSALDEHLLSGLETHGVPKALSGTVIPFSYNDIDTFRSIVTDYDLAAVKMEVQRSNPPKRGFLEEVRQLCTDHGIVLIFDECTSGFRETFGGLHLKYNVLPDMAIFGKALGNGYAITAILGKEPVMQSAQTSFISSTFWTERIGPTAALKTLEIMEREESWLRISELGDYLKQSWLQLASCHSLDVSVAGLRSLPAFTFNSVNHLHYKTLISQEMLHYGYLASTSCYVSIAHSKTIIDQYISCLDTVFSLISQCETGRKDICELLDGPVCHSGFQRLN